MAFRVKRPINNKYTSKCGIHCLAMSFAILQKMLTPEDAAKREQKLKKLFEAAKTSPLLNATVKSFNENTETLINIAEFEKEYQAFIERLKSQTSND